MLRLTRWLTALVGLALLAANGASAVAAVSGQKAASGSAGSVEHRLGENSLASPDRVSEKLASLYDLASDFPVAARAIGHSVDDLSRAAGALDRNGVSAAARALQSHFDRGGSAFPRITGNAASRNAAGQAVVDDILTSPGATFTRRSTGRFGEVLDVRAPDGRGVRFGSDGRFIGLLEP